MSVRLLSTVTWRLMSPACHTVCRHLTGSHTSNRIHHKNFLGRRLLNLNDVNGLSVLYASRHQTSAPELSAVDCLDVTSPRGNLQVPYLWLRDHCRCPRCYNTKTFQKNVDADLLIKDLTPADVTTSRDGTVITITWKDGHQSQFTSEWITDNFYPGTLTRGYKRRLWDRAVMESVGLPVVPFHDHMTSEAGLKQSLCNLINYGITIVSGVEATEASTQLVSERVTYVMKTLFGEMWTFTSDVSRSDTAYTTQQLGAHTDNTYLNTPAGIQVFHCLEHRGSGGATLLVDGFNALETLKKTDPASFEILVQTPVIHEYKEEVSSVSPGYHISSLAPVVSLHPTSQEFVNIRFNPYDRAPLSTVKPEVMHQFYTAYDKLSGIITDPRHEFWVKLTPGNVLFIDNWRVLHGRAAFDGKRVMCGCYLPREEWISKSRVMGLL
ncbi:trimethyllysine dioxygenase, mitochondrial-like isoform X1 [Physella acuta]|uniref:trimethyllysine dioxygenase, mitochondrial-like isoform X1 n=1 Tax=Physella acuta TaxID=109671 RepID=UPI0027DD1C48|nr:trimethyllysine dioxygenase, mitochondrial-like isoform X1 [Physella acuta]XP_059153734.1 trimethyllysine dioxygenase, mitochondrial-like isoform X1 [Physella acuta]